MALGLPSGISPRPRCGSDPRKKHSLPGSGFGRVWSCLVRSTSLFASFLRSLSRYLGIRVDSVSCLLDPVPMYVLALSLGAHLGYLEWEPADQLVAADWLVAD
jgi:hypothetical protein